jgi:hypothetical protein
VQPPDIGALPAAARSGLADCAASNIGNAINTRAVSAKLARRIIGDILARMESLGTHVFQSNKIAIGKLPQGKSSLPATHRTDILRSRQSTVNAAN